MMKINCSYCENCDTLWDNKELDADGLCFDCQNPTIAMVARPTNATQAEIKRLTDALELIADPDYVHISQLKDVAKKALGAK